MKVGDRDPECLKSPRECDVDATSPSTNTFLTRLSLITRLTSKGYLPR